jgi:hypothetical protein
MPSHADAQQTLCAQTSLRHSAFMLQRPMGELGPMQWPSTQDVPVAQSVGPLQSTRQVPFRQVYGAQTRFCPPKQDPAPLQTEVTANVVPEQDPAAHMVPGEYSAHPPTPSQVPFCPHEAAPWSTQAACGSGRPAATSKQVPTRPCSAQETQAPLQAVSQQAPSTQNPLAQAAPAAQATPRGALPRPSLASVAASPKALASVPDPTKSNPAASRAGRGTARPPASGTEDVSDLLTQPGAMATNNKIPPRPAIRIMALRPFRAGLYRNLSLRRCAL